MDCIALIIKGFIIGIAKIVPGVSGALLAITLGLYEKAMEAISCFFQHPKKYFSFLMCLGFGILCAIVFGSHVITFLLHTFYLPTMLFFIGLMIGGIPSFYDGFSGQKRTWTETVCFLLPFFLVLLLSFQLNFKTNITLQEATIPLLFFMGLIEVATTIIPGISGTAIFMLMGCYSLLLELFSMLGSLQQMVSYAYLLVPFGVGILLGLFVIAKIMTMLFHKYYVKTNYMILGFSTSSVILLLLQTLQRNYCMLEVIFSLLFLLLGYKITKYLPQSGHNEL